MLCLNGFDWTLGLSLPLLVPCDVIKKTAFFIAIHQAFYDSKGIVQLAAIRSWSWLSSVLMKNFQAHLRQGQRNVSKLLACGEILSIYSVKIIVNWCAISIAVVYCVTRQSLKTAPRNSL